MKQLINIQQNHINEFNKYFDQAYTPSRTHAEQYYKYIIPFLNNCNKNKSIDQAQLIRYTIKIDIDLDIEEPFLEELNYNWKCNTYVEIIMYFEHN
jgi:hypothetical protein